VPRSRNATVGSIPCALVLCAVVAGCQPGSYLITPVPADKSLRQRELERTSYFTTDKIALIDIEGVLLDESPRGLISPGENPVSLFVEKLRAAEKDKHVKGIVLRINSPGGTVTASQIIHDEIEAYKKRTGRPVITIMLDVTASGGYYLACASDQLIAYPSTITGSIGVVMQMFNLAGTLEKIGVETDAIKSGPNKDAGSPFRKMSPEEREIFQTLVNEFYEQFIAVVHAGRPAINEQKLRSLADGRVFSAQQALEAGLIDQIGTIHDAVAEVRKRAGLEQYRLVTFRRPYGWKPTVYARTPDAPASQINLINISLPDWLALQQSPRFMYLWAPGQ
jgi:protease-4